jgi:hypothetical protein
MDTDENFAPMVHARFGLILFLVNRQKSSVDEPLQLQFS